MADHDDSIAYVASTDFKTGRLRAQYTIWDHVWCQNCTDLATEVCGLERHSMEPIRKVLTDDVLVLDRLGRWLSLLPHLVTDADVLLDLRARIEIVKTYSDAVKNLLLDTAKWNASTEQQLVSTVLGLRLYQTVAVYINEFLTALIHQTEQHEAQDLSMRTRLPQAPPQDVPQAPPQDAPQAPPQDVPQATVRVKTPERSSPPASSAKHSWECPICGKISTHKSHHTAHMTVHSSERPFSCNTCGKAFKLKGDCNKHEAIHAVNKPFLCTMCHKRFSRNDALKVHLRSHTGERPFLCSCCSKSFTTKSAHNAHKKVCSQKSPPAS